MIYKYVGNIGWTAKLAANRSVGVPSEVKECVHVMKHSSQGSYPSFETRTDFTKNMKQGYQWCQEKNLQKFTKNLLLLIC